MTALRSYGDACGIARALDVIGERWALLIVRELLFGPKRFTDLREALTGVSPNVVSQRLRELVAAGVVGRRMEGGRVYELTPWGLDLHPVLVALGRWGARSPARPKGRLSADALMVALESTFVPAQAADLRATYELRLGHRRFTVEVDRGVIAIGSGAPRRPDAVVVTDPGTLRRLVFGDRRPAGAPVDVRGDSRLARRFFRVFARPRPAEA